MNRPLASLAALLFWALTAQAADHEQGLLDLQVNEDAGQVLLHFSELPAEFIYVPALQSGVGSNDLGLDRGQIEPSRWVRFERYGNKVLLVEPNLKFRADTDNASEATAVREAFATSVLAGFEIQSAEDGITIDLAPLLLSDVLRISTLVSEMEQGSFKLDEARTAIDTADIRNFPDNTLIPVVATFSGSDAGDFIRDVTPTADSLSVRVTHQFIRLPDNDYQPRRFHPRSGLFDQSYTDYAAPLGQDMVKRNIYRHDLQPGQELIYYVDNGTPEPVRSALIEGASWWAEAFEAAGFPGGYRVDVMPEGADPLDVRYNAIQWVHRSTRGWSYGFNISDPRTGQILKGHVSLGSLRVRQDQLIAEALTAPFEQGDEKSTAAMDMALARLRQLSAHEVGHTLGLSHNFAASFVGDKSVMDYPHPYLRLDDQGRVRLDQAYATGVSEWDRLAIRYGYQQFERQDEAAGLAAILDEASDKGLLFISDPDSRVVGSAHPESHLWDNGQDILERLDELLNIRQAGLAGLSTAVIPAGQPLFEIERRLVPVFLVHRYQVEASAKLLGGLYYDYSIRGEDVDRPLQTVPAATQYKAMGDLLSLLNAEMLALPEHIRYLIPPAPDGYRRDREFFRGKTAMTFDHLSPARAGAEMVLGELIQAPRLSRMSEQKSLDPALPGAEELFDALLQASWLADRKEDSYLAAIQREVDWLALEALFQQAVSGQASASVREHAMAAVIDLNDSLQRAARRGDAHAKAGRQAIRQFLDQPVQINEPPASSVPPGSPIGQY